MSRIAGAMGPAAATNPAGGRSTSSDLMLAAVGMEGPPTAKVVRSSGLRSSSPIGEHVDAESLSLAAITTTTTIYNYNYLLLLLLLQGLVIVVVASRGSK